MKIRNTYNKEASVFENENNRGTKKYYTDD